MSDIGTTKFGDYHFPAWADLLGWFIGASTLLPFPLFVAYHWIKGEVSEGSPTLRPTMNINALFPARPGILEHVQTLFELGISGRAQQKGTSAGHDGIPERRQPGQLRQHGQQGQRSGEPWLRTNLKRKWR